VERPLRERFDEDAERYDRARPRYPAALYDDLFALARLTPGSRVLEIGCGTGQATGELAARGCRVLAVELGPNLAAVAARNLEPYPEVHVVVAPFEEFELPPEPFDAVVAFTSFHWIDSDVGTAKVAAALRPGGAFAVVSTEHVAGGTDPFFVDVQECYERWDPETPKGGVRLEDADDVVARIDVDPDAEGRFGRAEGRRHEVDIAYSTASYLDVLMTYSGHRAMDADARDGLLSCIAALIDGRYGGLIVKRYLHVLRVSHRTP
jgi:SAM-dependent methyltransferase